MRIDNFRIYGNYTDASNYEALTLDYNITNANAYSIGVTKAGTGLSRQTYIFSSGALGVGAGSGQALTLYSNNNTYASSVIIDVGGTIRPGAGTDASSIGTSGNKWVNAYFSGVVNTGQISTTGYTVATLPTGVVGMRAYVTDALAPSYSASVVGGGAVKIPVFYNGAAWICA